MKKNNSDKIDIGKLNDTIDISRKILKISFVLIIIGVILLITYLFKEWKIISFIETILVLLSPLFIGIVIAWLLQPIVDFLEKNGVGRIFAIILVFLSFISLLILSLVLLIPSLLSQINDFISNSPTILNNVSGNFNSFFNKLSAIYNYDFSSIKSQIYSTMSGFVSSISVGLPNTIINIASSIVNGGLNIIFGLFIAFYLMFDFKNIRKNLLKFVPKKVHADTITLTDSLNSSLKNYVQGTLLITLILFVVQSITLAIAGLSSPMLFGLFCAITNIIPYIGPYIGAIPAVIVGFTISPVVGVSTLIAVVVVQAIESYFLNPIIMSKTMKLHPVTIMIGLLIFGHFFGILGMILATPVISCCKIVLNFLNEKYEILSIINNK